MALGIVAALGLGMVTALAHLAAQAPASSPPSSPADDWPTYNRSYTGERFSPLDQITTRNVAALKPVCTYDTTEQVSFQSGPVVVNGVLYVTSDRNTYAIDAATCALKWKQSLAFAPSSLQTNRGVAYANGRVFRGAGPGHVIALNASDGRTVWDVQLTEQAAVTVPMAPVAWNGMLFVGNAGGDNFGVTGHVWALDQKDGHTIWRFDVVPESGPARETWRNAPGVPITGGAFWTTFALDPEAGVLFVPARNPAPDFQPEARPGENLYTNSVIAIDTQTGKRIDHIQLVKQDFHDWDVDSGPVLLTTQGGRRIIASANKDGLLSAVDRSPMLLRWQTPTTTRENVEAPLVPGRPVRFCPGTTGGSEWNGPAFDRSLNLLFVGAVDWCSTVIAQSADGVAGRIGGPYPGAANGFGDKDPFEKSQGWISAIDADSGMVRWKYRSAMPVVAGVTPTAGGLVFSGELDGNAIALDATTGAVLWRHATDNAIGGGVVTYRAGGKQLVAVAAGMKSRVWPVPVQSNRIIVFGLP